MTLTLLGGSATATAQNALAPQPPAVTSSPTGLSARQPGLAADARGSFAGEAFAGRRVNEVRIDGHRLVPESAIRNTLRTRAGEPLDPAIVRQDYTRLFALRRFNDVEALVELTDDDGVVVTFRVAEVRQVRDILLVGNARVPDRTLRGVMDLNVGEAIDPFRVSLAVRAVEQAYRERNFPFARVEVDRERLDLTGDVLLNVVEGPRVTVSDIHFVGNNEVSDFRLERQVRTRPYFPVLRSGIFDVERIEDDVANVRSYYLRRGYFDARVGRRLRFSADNDRVGVDFLIDEGPRYTVGRVTFNGMQTLNEDEVRAQLRLVEGRPYDAEVLQRDIRRIIAAYGPSGYIYEPGSEDPDYLRIDARPVFGREPGTLELVYDVREGKPFRVGDVLVRGNSRTQEKVVLRELRLAPGDRYDSAELLRARQRLAATPYFTNVRITPVGADPQERDLLIEVEEARTALLTLGAGINSNGGVGGNITYLQRNFDITHWPRSARDIFGDRAFVGAGQLFRVSLEPGTEATNASVLFREPYLFDQPYSFTTELYFRDRRRQRYDERRAGGRVAVGRRFGQDERLGVELGLRVEDVNVRDIQDPPIRAFEILDAQGSTLLTSVGITARYDTTERAPIPSSGHVTTAGVEFFGALGGDESYQQVTVAHDRYYLIREDLLDRPTVLALHADASYIFGDAPFFNRLYGGGIGSVRGFSFRGITPRSGPANDRVGGDFSATASAEVSFPLAGDNLRGVVFADAGTVESEFTAGTIRTSVGAGLRVTLDFLGQIPIAIDFAAPLTKDDLDDTQIVSFSLGILP